MRLTLAALVLLAAPASASTPEAWAAGNAAARAACRRASGLASAIASAPILFSDAAGKTAILVTGRYRQRFLRGTSSRMLCLYDRRTKRAELSEAAGWTAP